MPDSHSLYVFSLSEVFTFLFVGLGPLRAIGPFAILTSGLDEAGSRRAGLMGGSIATGILIAGGFVGSKLLANWNVSPGTLAITAGIILFLIGLPMVVTTLRQPPPMAAVAPEQATRSIIEMLVFPFGLATFMLFLTLMPDQSLGIVGVLIGIEILNVLAMVFARPILARFGIVLRVVGMVLGVAQVALAIQAMVFGIRLLAAQFGLIHGI